MNNYIKLCLLLAMSLPFAGCNTYSEVDSNDRSQAVYVNAQSGIVFQRVNGHVPWGDGWAMRRTQLFLNEGHQIIGVIYVANDKKYTYIGEERFLEFDGKPGDSFIVSNSAQQGKWLPQLINTKSREVVAIPQY